MDPRDKLDRAGVMASVLCALHCAAAPILLIVSPAVGGLWVHPLTHIAIAALVLPVAILAIRGGFKIHGKSWVVAVGAVGAVLVMTGMLLPYMTEPAQVAGTDCDQCCPSLVPDVATGGSTLHIPPASIVTLLGGISLVVAHMANLRCCARCVRCAAAATPVG